MTDNPDDVEALWRLAKAHFDIADQTEDPTIHKEHFYPGLESAKKAMELNPKSARANHWYAVLIGKIGILEGTEQKIINSYDVEKHAKISIELDPDYDGTYHLMGRWHYELAELSWLERSIASLVYATPPEGSYKTALKLFKHAIRINSLEIRHHFWLAKTYDALGKYSLAKKEFRIVLSLKPKDKKDKIMQNKSKKYL